MSKFLKIGIILIIVAGVVFIAVTRLLEVRKEKEEAAVAKIYPIVVREMTPKKSKAKLTLPYIAEVANDKDVKLASRVAARVISIEMSGSKVNAGDVVARLDTTNIKSNLASVEDELKATRIALKNLLATHQRTLKLLNVQGASIEQSQTEETKIATLRAKIAALKEKDIKLQNDLSYTIIKSPVDGVIAKTFSSKGTVSMPGRPLVDISSNNGFYLIVRTPNDIPTKGVEFNGKTYQANALGSTFHGLSEYKVYVPNRDLVTGDRVAINVVIFNQKATLLPFNAILNRNGKSYVLVIHKNRATPIQVHVLQTAQQGVVISEELKNEKIVLAKPDILLRLVSGYLLEIKE